MNSSSLRTHFEVSPVWIAGTLVFLKAVLLLLVLPSFQAWIAPNYGVGFADDYDVLARNIASGNGYRFFPDTALTMMREPGYPLVLAGLFHLFGDSISIARIANLIFSFFAALSLSRLARNISGNEWVARLAPALFLIHPGIVLSEARGGVEDLFIMLLLLFLEALYRAIDENRYRHFVIAGLLLGLSATVRSTALLFPGFLLVCSLLSAKYRQMLPSMLTRFACLMAAAVLVLAPWTVRNYQLTGAIVPTASVAGVSAYAGYHICTHLTFDNTFYAVDADAGNARTAVARNAGLKFKEMDNHYYLYFYDTRDELTYNHLLTERLKKLYLESPMLLPTCAAKNLFHFWFSGKNWRVTTLNVFIQLPYLLLAGFGFYFGLRGDRKALYVPLLIFVAYTLCVYTPILAQARYSLHLSPILSLAAATALMRRWNSSRSDSVLTSS